MKSTDSVPCPKMPGKATLPVESCVLRTVWLGRGHRKQLPAYPVCASCPLGRLRRKQLEATGWTLDLDKIRGRIAARIKAEKKARAASVKEMLPL